MSSKRKLGRQRIERTFFSLWNATIIDQGDSKRILMTSVITNDLIVEVTFVVEIKQSLGNHTPRLDKLDKREDIFRRNR